MTAAVLSTTPAATCAVRRLRGDEAVAASAALGPSRLPDHDPRWLAALREGLGHEPVLLLAERDGKPAAWMALAVVRGLFGRFLVSMPYLNAGGPLGDESAAGELISGAAGLADTLGVKFLELRGEQEHPHPEITHRMTAKVHMRKPLPATAAELWDVLKAAVRNQVRKGQKQNFTVTFGGGELLSDFYAVFSRNMRDLGTPVYGRRLFAAVLRSFADDAELCVLRDGPKPVAGALLVHGRGVTCVPSASSLREYNSSNANMLMYWHLQERAVLRGQDVFDFGRATADGNLFRFKKQWGAEPHPSVWEYVLRRGAADVVRPDNPTNRRLIGIWQRLPVSLANFIGPAIVRGIP